MADGGTASTHNIQPAEIQIHDTKAFVVSTGAINIRVVLHDIEYELVSAMRLLTRLEQAPGADGTNEWFLVRVEVIYDRDYIVPTSPLVGQVPRIRVADDARPSYKFLDYVLSSRGFSINKNLAGTDTAGREAATALLDESQRWLES